MAEVEDAYAVTIDAVIVGDVALSEQAHVYATREALANAAKHAGITTISLYVEVEPERVMAFVCDRGQEFTPEAVPRDRQGLRGSVIGRVQRHGGEVDIRSAIGDGTEVRLTMPIELTEDGA